jgi:hypothetical protein
LRILILILSAALGLIGCTSKPPIEPLAQAFVRNTYGIPHEPEIYAILKEEPVPLPQVTLYDGDARLRQVFVDGFRVGWDRAISGALFHDAYALMGRPEEGRVWKSGWRSGTQAGYARWKIESQRFAEKADDH